MHGDVITQEKGGGLERELESIIQLLELRLRQRQLAAGAD